MFGIDNPDSDLVLAGFSAGGVCVALQPDVTSQESAHRPVCVHPTYCHYLARHALSRYFGLSSYFGPIVDAQRARGSLHGLETDARWHNAMSNAGWEGATLAEALARSSALLLNAEAHLEQNTPRGLLQH
jgi:hypothetical protein